jgi:predicted ATP-dependent serine protease
MYRCEFCETVSDFLKGYCEECLDYKGIVPNNSEHDEWFNEELIDYYAEASLFGDC